MSESTVAAAIAALGAGRLVGIPTDTVYGIAADPGSEAGLHALLELKGRSPDHPVALLVADLDQARELCLISAAARDLARRYWPGPLTMVLAAAPGLPLWIGDRERRTVGVRIPDHPIALALLGAAGALAVSSANLTGEEPAVSDVAARATFGDGVAVYLAGEGTAGMASTVVDMTVEPFAVLRQGPIVLT